jgi:uncharacterized membrane protein
MVNMTFKRIIKHLLTSQRHVKRLFPQRTLQVIEQAIQASEIHHEGEIRFAIESALEGYALFQNQSPRERAVHVFSELRVWDTELNSGVLIYILLADQAVEIVADRGINARTNPSIWKTICTQIESDFAQGHYESGAVKGIEAITSLLITHLPAHTTKSNELPNDPIILA